MPIDAPPRSGRYRCLVCETDDRSFSCMRLMIVQDACALRERQALHSDACPAARTTQRRLRSSCVHAHFRAGCPHGARAPRATSCDRAAGARADRASPPTCTSTLSYRTLELNEHSTKTRHTPGSGPQPHMTYEFAVGLSAPSPPTAHCSHGLVSGEGAQRRSVPLPRSVTAAGNTLR